MLIKQSLSLPRNLALGTFGAFSVLNKGISAVSAGISADSFNEVSSPEVALYFYKSTMWHCMKYCCNVRAGAFSCYLELLDKPQKWICRTVSPSLAACLESLAHRQNVASLSLFYRYYFCRCSSKLAQLVSVPYSRGRSNQYSVIDCMIFLSSFML